MTRISTSMKHSSARLNVQRILMRMNELQMTRKSLAEELDCNLTTLWRYFTKGSGNNLRVAKALASTLQLPLEQIISQPASAQIASMSRVKAFKKSTHVKCPLCEQVKTIA